MSVVIFCPSYFRVVKCEKGKWFIKGAKLCSPNHVPIALKTSESYGVTNNDLLVSLFRINGGKAGYYLANLRDKEYCYCGLELEDVQKVLRSLGIGRDEPAQM